MISSRVSIRVVADIQHPLVILELAAAALVVREVYLLVLHGVDKVALVMYQILQGLVLYMALAAVVAARLSGEQLAGGTQGAGTLGSHMFWGLIAPWPAALLAVATIGLVVSDRGRRTPLLTAFTVLGIVAALASLAVVGWTGHLGATAVWVG